MDVYEYIGEGVVASRARRALIKRLRSEGGDAMQQFWTAYRAEVTRVRLEVLGEEPDDVATRSDCEDYFWSGIVLLGRDLAAQAIELNGEGVPDYGEIALDFAEQFEVAFERETGELLDQDGGGGALPRIWPQQMYSEDGLPVTLVQGWLDAFHEVMESPEIVAGLDATGVARLEIWASITHDPEHGWPVASSEVSSQRVRKRRNDVVVDVTWETAALRSAGYGEGVTMVADVIDALAAQRSGLPAASGVAGLVGLWEGTLEGRAEKYVSVSPKERAEREAEVAEVARIVRETHPPGECWFPGEPRPESLA